MIINPIYINENSGSGGENDWDPTNMKEDVMLDLTDYSYWRSSGNELIDASILNGKTIIIVSNIPSNIDESSYFDINVRYYVPNGGAIKIKFNVNQFSGIVRIIVNNVTIYMK